MASHIPYSTILILSLGYTGHLFSNAAVPTDSLPKEYDICSLESSLPSSVELSRPGDVIHVYVNWTHQSELWNSHTCVASFETCNHCRIRVNYVEPMFNFPECHQKSGTMESCIPSCVYLLLSDPNYKSRPWKRVSKSLAIKGFESLSKLLKIVACGNHIFSSNITMRIQLTAVEKVQLINGNMFQPRSHRTISSPDFPNPYVGDNEYFIYRFQSSWPNTYITLTFDDWMMTPYSTIQFQGANIVNRITGLSTRPYVVSNEQSMNMTFSTGEHRKVSNNYSFLGFKAVARFYASLLDIPKIETGCDYEISSSEGGIMHLNAAADGLNRDCIWVIKRVPSYNGVYLKIVRYKTRYELLDSCDYSLEVRGGLTSTADQLLKMRPNDHILSDAVQLSQDGFYIRIKGCYFDDAVVISYAMYLNDCSDYREHYKCDNGKCISEHLKCDTFDHCGDNSDEIPSMCDHFSNNVSNASSGGYDYSLSIHVIIPMVVSVVLGIGIVCLLIILIRRCRRLGNATSRSHHDRVQRNRDRNRRNMDGLLSVTMSSGEHPPAYEDVIRTTPIGQLNMAFSWSPCENAFIQPPSYEEAVSPTSGTTQHNDCSMIATHTANNGSEYHSETIDNLQQPNLLPAITSTIPTSMFPQVDIFSSSSSIDESTCNSHPLDVTSPSDVSTRDEHFHITNNYKTSNSDQENNETNHETKSQKTKIWNRKNLLEVSAFPKTNTENKIVAKYDDTILDKTTESVTAKNVKVEDQNQSNKIKTKDLIRDSHVANKRYRQDRNMVGRQCYTSDLDDDDTYQVQSEDIGKVVDANRRHDRRMFDVYFENDENSSDRSCYRDEVQTSDCVPMGNTNLNVCVPSLSYHHSKTRSCNNLSGDLGSEMLVDAIDDKLHEDKRFSYAGVGDVSLTRRNADPSHERVENQLQNKIAKK